MNLLSFFKSHSFTRHSRESYLYRDKLGREAEIVVYEVPRSEPRYRIDDVALTAWLKPREQPLTREEKEVLLQKLQKHLGKSVSLESEFRG